MKMKEIRPKRAEIAEISSSETRIFRFFFSTAKISSLGMFEKVV